MLNKAFVCIWIYQLPSFAYADIRGSKVRVFEIQIVNGD